MKKLTLIFPLVLLVLAGCRATDAMNSTSEMNGKMDSMVKGMDETTAGINTTNEAVRMQKMALALDNMLKDYNTEKLEPVPFGMLAGAKTFAETATVKELSEYMFTLYKSIEEFTIEEGENVAHFNKKKDIDWNQMLAIAGLAPEQKIREVVETQILKGGRFTDVAYAILMARAKFLGMYLNNSLFKQAKYIEGLEETFTQLTALDSILKSSFKAEIKVEIDNTANGMKKPIMEYLYTAEGDFGDGSWDPKLNWKKLRNIIKNNYKEGSPSVLNAEVKMKAQRIQDQVEENIQFWNK